MKKKKLKKSVKIIIVIIMVFFVIIFNNNSTIINENKENVNFIVKINEYKLPTITNDFLEWIDDEFPNSLENLYNLLSDIKYDENIWHQITGYSLFVLKDKYNLNNGSIEIKDENTITFLGDVSFADNYYVMQAYNERMKGLEGILSVEMINYLNESGITIANSEFVLADEGVPMPGKAYTFIGNTNNAKIFFDMGVDLVTLANNHVYDYGSDAFNQTLDTFDNIGIPRIGAGKNIQEASKAQYFIINGYKVAFVNANRSEKYILTPGATDTSEGVVRCYDPSHFISMIEKEKKESDIVIAIIHWGLEYSHEIEDVLLETGKLYIDAGADAIIGHHAHVLQGIEIYNDKPIFYNLGNFIFNNKTLDSAVVTFTIQENMKMTYQIIPALQSNIYNDFVYGEDKQKLIDELNNWSINAYIDSEGFVTQKK